MQCKIFYSWQSDLPNPGNRNFIENSLKESVRSIHNDDSIEVELVIDRDTAGIAGSPSIADTIFEKIENANVFVCDISIIKSIETPPTPSTPSTPSTRKTPNPNVLIELGYAAKVLGWENIIMVINTAFGIPEDLPFDLRNRRMITYNSPIESQDRTGERRELKGKLEGQLRIIIQNLDTKQNTTTQEETITEQVVSACEQNLPNQESLIQEYMAGLREKLISIDPSTSRPPNTYFDDLLVNAIDQTEELILEFAHVTKTIAVNKNAIAAHKLYKEFQVILELYKFRPDQTSWIETDFDFYKFIGHEFFVTFFSFLISENLWQIIANILSTEIYIKNSGYKNEPGLVPFIYASSHNIRTLDDRNRRLRYNRTSIHADILNNRHSSQEKITTAIPMQSFMDADYFLFLTSLCRSSSLEIWVPWSHVYMNDVPRYLVESSSAKYAAQLLPAIGVENITKFREYSDAASRRISQLISTTFPNATPLSTFDSSTIGSKP